MFSGCQFSIYPMSDQFVDIILPAVAKLHQFTDLRIQTDDLSTLVVGPPERVFAAVTAAFAAACHQGGHVVLSALFSQGCPGEPDDPICTPNAAPNAYAEPQQQSLTGVPTEAQFSLYPLGYTDYMPLIAEVVDAAQAAGTLDERKHFCSRLRGDLAQVMLSVEQAFHHAASRTGHVVIHLTASTGSPSLKQTQHS